MSSVAIAPYKMSSEGAKKLATALGVPLLASNQISSWGGRNHVLINWGCGELLDYPRPHTWIINKPETVCTAIDKRFLFKTPATFPRPAHTESRDEAMRWVIEGRSVCARTSIGGCDGAGLIIVPKYFLDWEGPFPYAKLYTEFVPCDREYRVHVAFGNVIAVQIRAEVSNWLGNRDNRVRTTSNGYGFNVPDDYPEAIVSAALGCFEEFELDFMALDILYDSETEKAYVLEFNSAPEMTDYTTRKYCKVFMEEIGNG